MFGIGKHSIRGAGLLKGLRDYHTHILPGVDDGVKSIDEALKLLAEYEKLGIREAHLTPHIMEDIPRNTPGYLQRVYDELRASYRGKVEIRLSGEYMLDYAVWKTIKERNVVTDGNRILVELPLTGKLADWDGRLDEVADLGYEVVLAHPERYHFFELRDYQHLLSRGIKFQLNLFSLVGIYRTEVMCKARKILDKGYYSYVGTDVHSYESFMWFIGLRRLTGTQVRQLKLLIDQTGSEISR